MRPRRSFALALLVLSACTRSRTLPLTQLDGTTRIEVRSRYDSSASHVIVARDEIGRATAVVRSLDSGWREEMATLPAGSVVAVFYRDTTTVDVFRVGSNFIEARGLIRTATPEELQRLADAFGIPKKSIDVPPRPR